MLNLNRKELLMGSLAGVGALGFNQAGLMGQTKLPSLGLHHAPKIKRVIHLCMAGGMSQFETFDNKPKLTEMDGKPMPDSYTNGEQLAQLQGAKLLCLGNQHKFKKCGQSGVEISDIFPHLQTVADDIAVIRSMKTEQINHDPAHTFMNTGSIIPGRPSMGSWVMHALNAEGKNLPGYIVLTSEGGGQGQPISSKQWHNGFLPGKLQGVQFQSKGSPILYVDNPAGVTREAQGDVLSSVTALNRLKAKHVVDPEIETRIAQSQLAYQMQESVPELVDFSGESKSTLDMYGCKQGDGSFASNCLLARRLAERGVRFIQLYHRGWDHHNGVKAASQKTAGLTDQGAAALIKDLKQRGMLEDTLIIFGSEFGRTPMKQGGMGRDHHILSFSLFMCGGGIKGGTTYGSTDELGYRSVENITTVHDLHATMLHLLGINHLKLTHRFQGRDFRLTDVHGHILKGVLS